MWGFWLDIARVGDEGFCCSDSCCGGSEGGALDVDLTEGAYSEEDKRGLPQAAVEASLGCGNPVALATLSAGEVVLDLGSGGGIDVLLSAWPREARRMAWT
jgi:hypothetical protein